MYVLLVTIQIKPEHRDRFIEEMILDAKGSRENEPGCLQFDVIQDEADPNKIYLYEVYKDRAAFDAHLQTPHLHRWREAVKDWYASPQVAAKGYNIDPPDSEWR